MISTCLAKQTAAVGIGISTLASVTPDGLFSAWEKGGMVAVSLVFVAVVWGASRADQRTAERRRAAREDEMRKWREDDIAYRESREQRDHTRHTETITALTGLGHRIVENSTRCDARRASLEGMVGNVISKIPRKQKIRKAQ